MTIRGIFKNTARHRRYWKDRKIDWRQAYWNLDHPHRMKIIDILRQFDFRTILEMGCAAGANLALIKQHFPGVDVGGIDWNAEAIETAKSMLPHSSVLQVGEATDVYLSDKGTDVVLSDMCYIYLDKKNFHKAIREAKRMARRGVIFCEFHHPNPFMRWLLKWNTGYNSYNYGKELKKLGFYDIHLYKLTESDWPGGEPQKTFGYIISARI